MKVLVTGNLGYIGVEVVNLLISKNYTVIGLDNDYFRGCEFFPYTRPTHQVYKDIRNITLQDFKKLDGVIHLAALSNDPIGDLDPDVTYDINHKSAVKLAEYAKKLGIPRFVMASSCSVYGIATETVSELSPVNPITAYAKAKLFAENDIKNLASDTFSPVFLRPATAYGISAKFRSDIVLNNLCANAITSGKITVKSDGTPIRPAVHVRDLANAFIALMEAPKELVHNEVFNIGKNNDNYTIMQMADTTKKLLPHCELIFTGEHSDNRSYSVNFDKLHTRLKNYLRMEWDIHSGSEQLLKYFEENKNFKHDFNSNKFSRLETIKNHIVSSRLTDDLYWK